MCHAPLPTFIRKVVQRHYFHFHYSNYLMRCVPPSLTSARSFNFHYPTTSRESPTSTLPIYPICKIWTLVFVLYFSFLIFVLNLWNMLLSFWPGCYCTSLKESQQLYFRRAVSCHASPDRKWDQRTENFYQTFIDTFGKGMDPIFLALSVLTGFLD